MKIKLWAQLAEIAASVAVLVTLIILLVQLRESSDIQMYQAEIRQSEWENQIFVESNRLAGILAKIKAVDDIEPHVQEVMDRYDMSYQEAAIWLRYMFIHWSGRQADFLFSGPSNRLANSIRNLAQYPDQQLFLQSAQFESSFQAYIDSVIDSE